MRERFLLMAMALLLFVPAKATGAQLAFALIDRKFPIFSFCPVDTEGPSLVAFTAPSNGAVRVTFAAENFYGPPGGTREYNEPRVDNVMVIPRALWDANTSVCSQECFTENGEHQPAPNYPSDSASLAALPFVQLLDEDPFLATPGLWEGGTWDTDSTAPVDDASGTDCLFAFGGGSLRLGLESEGDVMVSSTVNVAGLTPGEEYVVFAWLYVRGTGACTPPSDCYTQLSIVVDENETVGTEPSSFGRIKADFR